MGLLAEIFLGFTRKDSKNDTDKRSHYIFYKIVDSTKEWGYRLQCINTRAIFHAKISDIILDMDILHGLHPVQACYIGIKYAQYLKKADFSSTLRNSQNHNPNKYSVCRYGTYNLYSQNRKGALCFINNKTNEEFVMDPRDIACSEALIGEFDAAQAFYIGLLSGLKMSHCAAKRHQVSIELKRPNLWLVK